jgi:hypothetical protein
MDVDTTLGQPLLPEGEQTSKQRRYLHTRRITGRRSITPIRSRHKKLIKKTRGHKVERKPYVSILKHATAHSHGEWNQTDKSEFGDDQERKRVKDSSLNGEWKDPKEHTQAEQSGTTENSEESVHPGPIQTVSNMPESTASSETSDKTEIESEQLQ